MPTHPHRSARRGFSLVELLAVIAILGLLAGLLIPVLGKTRWNARSTQCTANVRQLVQGFLLYAAENKGRLPAWEKAGEADENYAFKVLYNTGIVKNPETFVCPVTQATDQASVGGAFLGDQYPCYYSSNQTIAPKWGPKAGRTYARPSRLTDENADKLPVVWDQRANTITNVNRHRPSDTRYGGVFGYLDGSVAYLVSPQDIVRLP